ncbi:MAG: hypothetical protein JJU02_14670 [Cryomorphaceae bacterium]|nr:hypothetical protein [Cryomorphaceae bacterium]
MKKVITSLSALALIFSMTSCDELGDMLNISAEPTFEESMSIDLPDSANPGMSQTAYMGYYRIIDLEGGEEAPKELGGDISKATEISIKELYFKIGGVNAITTTHTPTVGGKVIFFQADHFDENSFPDDAISGSELPEGLFDGGLIGTINTESTNFSELDRWSYNDGEGTFTLKIDEEEILENVVSAICSKGKVGVAVYMEFNGEMPFAAEAALGMTVDLSIKP